MATDITMPKLTDTMAEGTIVRWLKHVGDRVTAGDILAEVETDKADMELEAAHSGVVTAIKVNEGDTAPVGAVIAVLGAENEGIVARDGGASKSAPPTKPAAPVPPPTPLARRAAQERGVAVQAIAGSGARGRVVRRDVEPMQRTAPTVVPAAPAGRVAFSKMRLTIAKRMAEAKRDVPHFYLTSEVEMDAAIALRASLEKTGVIREPVTVTHLLIKAVALALQRHPRVNAAWDNDGLRFSDAINIGIATAIDDGLLVPVLKGCERLSLEAIATGARQLNEKARGGRFSADEMLGGTFTISNLGMFDVDEFSAVINPPQAGILAVGTVKERAIARGGALVVARTMRVTLSCDHRVLNGVEGAQFLQELKRLLENPVTLVMSSG
jgi:pyruvate dehydrogenase E2 component (dihydrolipoamide acetyltransferase)